MRRSIQLIGLVLALLALTLQPVAGQEGNPAAGEEIYISSCAACHGQDGSGSIPGTPDMTDPATWEQIPRQQHVESVKTGVEGTQMPAFEDQMSEQEIQDVVAYERSLPEAGSGEEEGDTGEEASGEAESTSEGNEPAVTPVNQNLPGFTGLTALAAFSIIGILGVVSRARSRK